MLLRKWLAVGCALAFVTGTCCGQQAKKNGNRDKTRGRGGLPSVSALVRQFDKNGDGKLTKDEVVDSRYNRQFPRWDTNKDGKVTEDEIAKFRRRFGVPVEGTARAPNRRPTRQGNAIAKLTIPDVDDLLRVARGTRVPREVMRNSAFVMKTRSHAVAGNKYVILTDHTSREYLEPLQRLAQHRDGIIVRVADLALLYESAEKMSSVRKRLQAANVRYLAIAPRMETYRENMLLGMLELMSTIDDDPQLDAFPGFLLASSHEGFSELIDRSIKYKPQSSKALRPFAISQVPSTRELRSLQKSGILRKLFAEQGRKTPTVGIYSSGAAQAPKLPGDQFWSYQSKRRKDFLKEFPAAAATEFEKASLLVMHGHGIPGMSCGVDLSAIPKKLSAKVVLCGSCFSASPKKSDFPAMRQAPGGYGVEARDAFVIRAVDRGASVAFGHMRLSQGFPHLFPVLETWMKGKSVGQAYQELLNGLIELREFDSGEFVVTEKPANGRQPRQNILLYVVIGDPALQPFERMIR